MDTGNIRPLQRVPGEEKGIKLGVQPDPDILVAFARWLLLGALKWDAVWAEECLK